MLSRQYYKIFALCAVLLCVLNALAVSASAKQNPFAANVRPRHRTVLRKWLNRKPDLRPATKEDAGNTEGLAVAREIYGKNYDPYYAVGDFNLDGHEDFAIGLINRNKPVKFVIAIFNGPFRIGKMSAPAFFNESFDASYWLYVKPKNLLLVGPIETDIGVFIKPRGKGYVIKY